MESNRRRYLRMATARIPCVIKIDGVEIEAEVSDQSIGGVKVAGLSLKIMPHDQPVSVIFHGEQLDGLVKTVTRDPDGNLELGIERFEPEDDASQSSASGLLLNSYISHEGRDIVCIPISVDADNPTKLTVRLFNGHEFVVLQSMIHAKTRNEREEQLFDHSVRDWIARLYGILGKEVLDFEFGAAR